MREKLWFQFLLGRLKTHGELSFLRIPGPFQFLLGRLKTVVQKDNVVLSAMFQFLLGRLKTLLPVDLGPGDGTVSIPAR